MRELMLGPKRFGDLRASLPGLSANVLTQRLEGLEGHGVLKKRKLPPPASVQVYELTEWGLEAEPIIQSMGRWAARSPDHDVNQPLSAVGVMLSFRTMFDPAKADGAAMALGFRFGPESFVVRVGDGRLTATRTEPEGVDVTITGTPETVAGVVYGDPADVAAHMDEWLTVEGDREAFARFTGWFELPAKVERPVPA